jgi:cystathionine beta-lyase/cystathionine gamma-synthase
MVFASGQAAAAAVFRRSLPAMACLRRATCTGACGAGFRSSQRPGPLPLEFYDNASTDDLATKARALRPQLIWVETPANPTWDITDIAAAAELAREVGAIVAVDSTVATPLLTRPLALGAHIAMHSATKYLNGHSDVIAGAWRQHATTSDGSGSEAFAAAPARCSGHSRRGCCCAACARCTCAWRPRAQTRRQSPNDSRRITRCRTCFIRDCPRIPGM